MTLTSQDEKLSALSEKKPTSQNPVSPEIVSTIASTSEKVADITHPIQEESEDIEAKRDALLWKLDELSEELNAAMEEYYSVFWVRFWHIDGAAMNIKFASEDELRPLSIDTLEASTLFSNFEPKDIDVVKLYNSLITRLREQKDDTVKAHLLWFIDLLSIYVANKKANQILVDGGDVKIKDRDKYAEIKGVDKADLPDEKVEADGFKKIVFGNTKMNPSYQVLIKRIFDMMDKDPELMIDISTLLHKDHWNKLPDDTSRIAEQIAKIFE